MTTATESQFRTKFVQSRELQRRAHDLIPGGCHTYAKGDDQFPELAPGFIVRGEGCHVWDVDGNEYVEYGMGCRAVSLGHGHPAVVEAARNAMGFGSNFTRPAPLEVECADELLGLIESADMVKFCKDGSSATTAALKLARAHTGRDMIALCGDHPFFSTYDWFIGTTAFDGGIPESTKKLSVTFKYNDPDSLRTLFEQHPGRIAAVILEPAKYEAPKDGFLHTVRDLCREYGAVFVLDEMITGFRYHLNGAQKLYDIEPDLSTFGKALANGFSLSAIAGKREIMELGGLRHDRERVFLLSTTHGAETHALAAGIAAMRVYQTEPVIETLYEQGDKLRAGLERVIAEHGLEAHVPVIGPGCNMVFGARDRDGRPCQSFRSLLMQELIKRGVLGPSLVISYAHTDADLEHTVDAFDGALDVYARALEDGVENHLVGPPTKSVYRRFNRPAAGQDRS